MSICCHQVNLQTGWGGGEVYTVFFTRALMALGIPTVLYLNPGNPHWKKRLPANVRIVEIADPSQLLSVLKQTEDSWVLFHTALASLQLGELRSPCRLLSCIAHMPLYGRNPDRIAAHDYVIGVSEHVLDSLRDASIGHVHAEPLLGIADFSSQSKMTYQIRRNSRYDWDMRKVRDRLLGCFEPLFNMARPVRIFTKRPGITIGIVSRITPIKQFPKLFSVLSPVIARFPDINIEIFGAGGYASVRDLDGAFASIRQKVRFWGHQTDVRTVYRSIDYLMAGLPEKEALGLNVIESQSVGTPIIAVRSKPFTETVIDGVTGFLYKDPRLDGGEDFGRVIERLLSHPLKIDFNKSRKHLERFSETEFRLRVERLHTSVGKILENENTSYSPR